MINNNYMLYMLNRYSFDRMIDNNIQRAYELGLREKAERTSSYSSGGGRRPVGRNGRKIDF